MMTITDSAVLPAALQQIYDQVQQRPGPESNLDALQPVWDAYISRVADQIHRASIQDGGEVLYLGDLSPGCQACKDGTWDCIFVTMRCDLDCEFCYSPHNIPADYAGSAFGSTPEQIAANHTRTRITGISFSGGEPFVEAERLFEWVAWFTARFPDHYYWVYTNGLLANEDNLHRLSQLGIDEIRFNLAATGYDHPLVLDNLAAASRHIPNLTVEIPAIPQDGQKLLSCLADWVERGVRFLNLHELIYEPGTHSGNMPGNRQLIVTADGHRSYIDPRSRELTLTAMRHVQEHNLPLAVNDCSLQSKLRQLRGRRTCLAPLVKAPYERLIRGEILESYCAYHNSLAPTFFSSDSLSQADHQYPDHHLTRLTRTAPLSLDDDGRWIAFETL